MGKEVKQDELTDDQKVNNEEPKTDGEVETSQDDNAAFLAGFSKVSQLGADGGDTKTPDPEPTPELQTEDDVAEEADDEEEEEKPAKKTPVEKELERALERLSKAEGRLGNVLQKLNQLQAAQNKPVASTKATQQQSDKFPTQQQIKAALKDPEKVKQIMEDFPSFKPMLEEIEYANSKIEELKSSIIDEDRLVERVREKTEEDALYKEYPTWTDDVKTPEFKRFSLEGGPSEAEFMQLQRMTQNNPIGAQNVINSWQGLYPDWWEDKGSLIFSDRPSDTRRIMDMYSSVKDRQQEPPKPKKDRLRRAATPRGTSQPPATGISDDEAFRRGFSKVRSH